MTVVSNTTPLNYLVLIGQAEILNALYQSIIIPQAVFGELITSDRAPEIVRHWMGSQPAWLSVDEAPEIFDSNLDEIQIGERETILLAERVRSDFVILDDRKARRSADDRGLTVIGTLGILTAASEKGLINLRSARRFEAHQLSGVVPAA